MKRFLARSPIQPPDLLIEAWLAADGFTAQWECKWRGPNGRMATQTVQVGLLPYREAFGGERHLEDQAARTGSDQLLQWRVLDPERFESSAQFGYASPEKHTYEAFQALLKNCILLEFFSVDNQYYTLLKLDASGRQPELYLSYEHGLYPLTIRMADYFDAMMRLKGACWPWPLALVDDSEASVSVQRSVAEARSKVRELGPVLGVTWEAP